MKSYQIVQERYELGYDAPTVDFYPVLLGTPEECHAVVNRLGLTKMFQHTGDSYHIAELKENKWGQLDYTGATFPLAVLT